MTQIFWAHVTRKSSWVALLVSAMALAGSSAIAKELPQATAAANGNTVSGPIHDFNWLYDRSLLKDDHGREDEHEKPEAGEVRMEEHRSTTTTTTTTTVTQVRYTDVAANYWANDFVYRLSALKVVSGFPGGLFLPSNSLTQAQFAAMVAQAFERPTIRNVISISSLSRDYWAYQAIQTAYSTGFINLSGGTFNPNATLTRLDFLVQMARGLGITQVSSGRSVDQILSVFTDASSIPTEYRVIVAALVERGILVNYPQLRTLNLSQTVTRAEACSFVYQALVYLGKVEAIQSAYIVNSTNLSNVTNTTNTTTTNTTTTNTTTTTNGSSTSGESENEGRQHCNQGIGNGSEGCDPGNSHPHGGSNDEGGRTPGNR